MKGMRKSLQLIEIAHLKAARFASHLKTDLAANAM